MAPFLTAPSASASLVAAPRRLQSAGRATTVRAPRPATVGTIALSLLLPSPHPLFLPPPSVESSPYASSCQVERLLVWLVPATCQATAHAQPVHVPLGSPGAGLHIEATRHAAETLRRHLLTQALASETQRNIARRLARQDLAQFTLDIHKARVLAALSCALASMRAVPVQRCLPTISHTLSPPSSPLP